MASVMWKICVAILASVLILSDDFVEGSRNTCGEGGCYTVEYDSNDEDCCGGIVYLKAFSRTGEQLSKCCTLVFNERDVRGVMYSTETHDCCNSRAIIDKSTHACCGTSGSYELATQGCCNGQIYNKEEEICCNGIELHSKSEGDDTCCGNIPYNSNMSSCCEGEVKEGIGECCGNDIYIPNKDLCCQTIEGSVVHTPESHDFLSRAVQCCGTETYRPADQLCCNMVVHTKHSPSLKCCGSSTYDENKQICCQGRVSSRGTATACCGSDPFNEDNEACCDGEVIPWEGRASCCDGDPYNKERATCVDQYGIDGIISDVSDIPEITLRYYLGDNSTAYLSTEQFQCGGRLHKYKEGSTSCCARSIVYDSSQHLCCSTYTDSFLVEKTSPNAMCCGEGSFIPDTEGCCNGNETFVTATHQCCPDGVVRGVDENCDDLPDCSVQRGNDKTCVVYNDDFPEERFIYYNSETSVCTPSGVRALPPGLASCGDDVYRTSEEICCQDEIVQRFQNNMERECCYTYGFRKYYTPKTETCYNWEIHPIPKNVSEICSGHLYDSRYYGCDVAGRIRRKEDILENPDACYNEQIGLFYFNKLHHSCCAGHLIAAGHSCCDVSSECCQPNERQGYNTETHMCCDGNLVEKQEGHVCCGTQTYDSRESSKLCCMDKLHDSHNGNVWCEGETITGRLAENQIICRDNVYTGDNIGCCGAEQYDLEGEICCRDFKYSKTSDTSDCCGAIPYDTSGDALCCGGSLYLDAEENDECCGNVTYDTTSSTCCTTGGSEYVMSPGQCCSNGEEFDSSSHTCCDGLIHNYIANGECCGNHVIREPTREFCCAGRLVHHYGDKKCCDGRVTSLFVECSNVN
ncbi:Galaxin [Holothuria leucospilota]|uniref:Galaxin n=1 Tax=Holothuria leucospilota TaxID=206669 RepID=A0A9Q1CGU3_HOLLE|nr:Galaxin [Holothuria leucospilota]